MKSAQGLKLHQARHCPKRQSQEVIAQNAPPGAPIAKPAPRNEVVGFAPKYWLATRDRVTHGWFFRPPVVSATGNSVTGLPIDCFYNTSVHQSHQVDTQVRKTVDMPDGSVAHVELVCPVYAHNQMLKSFPHVALRPPEDHTWAKITGMLDAVREDEIELERNILEDLRSMYEKQTVPEGRAPMRAKIAEYERRIAALETGIDYNRLYQFFFQEHRRTFDEVNGLDPAFTAKVAQANAELAKLNVENAPQIEQAK